MFSMDAIKRSPALSLFPQSEHRCPAMPPIVNNAHLFDLRTISERDIALSMTFKVLAGRRISKFVVCHTCVVIRNVLIKLKQMQTVSNSE